MHAPLAGIRVVEVASIVYGPSAGTVLADWGADVIKVEHAVTGDSLRGIRGVSFFDQLNRGKRSMAVNLAIPEGRDIVYRLAERSDVFLTSMLPGPRQKLEIDVEHIRAHNPKIIYARASAVGPRGNERDKRGYDLTSYWARAGIADGLHAATPGSHPPGGLFGIGDMAAGAMLAGGIVAALLGRERTGEPAVVDASLLAAGLWVRAVDIAAAANGTYSGRPLVDIPGARQTAVSPLINYYRTRDGRFITLCVSEDRFFEDVCGDLDAPTWPRIRGLAPPNCGTRTAPPLSPPSTT